MIAVPGVALCAWAVYRFFATIIQNRLPWDDANTAQEHYLGVGRAFSAGFAAGFFMAFFLAVAAIAISAWARSRRAQRQARSTPLPRRRREDREGHRPADAPPEASPYPATSRR